MCDHCKEHANHAEVHIHADVLKIHSSLSEKNKNMFKEKKVKTFNILGSVGSGKTTLIKQLCAKLKDDFKIKVIAGDIETDIDSKRIEQEGVDVYQINTGGMCHLDANAVRAACEKLGLDDADLLFIENVGNLICPANFSLGEEKRIVIVSVTEGPYVAIKHPVMFRDADIVVVNKTDLEDAMHVDSDEIMKQVLEIKPSAHVIKASVKNGEGLDEIINALGLA